MWMMAIAAVLTGVAGQQAMDPPVSPTLIPPVVPAARISPDVPLGAIGSWTLYDQAGKRGGCGVSRNYGTLDTPAGIAFETIFGQRIVHIYLLSKGDGGAEATGDGGLTLDSGAHADAVYRSVDDPARSLRFGHVTIDGDVFEGLASAKTVQIRAGGTMAIPAQDVKAGLAAISACRDRTFASWRLDPKLISYDHPVPVDADIGSWFSNDDYPVAARRANASGRVVMVLDVGGDGLVKACRVVVSAGPDLDATSCALALRRGRFTPSPDKRASAIVSQALIPIRWSLQND